MDAEPAPAILQPDAIARIGLQASPAAMNTDLQPFALHRQARGDDYPMRASHFFDPMVKGVFQQRLQQERGHGRRMCGGVDLPIDLRSEEHTSELQSQSNLVC